MNTKEAIEFLNSFKWSSHRENLVEIIYLLQQGEKYEEMWEAFLDLPIKPFIRPEPINWELYLFRLRELEEKYFPDRESQIQVVK